MNLKKDAFIAKMRKDENSAMLREKRSGKKTKTAEPNIDGLTITQQRHLDRL